MGLLRSLLGSTSRRAVTRGPRTFVPYGTLPRFSGRWPFGPAGRGLSRTSNVFSPPLPLVIGGSLFPRKSLPLQMYEDRRLYHPEGKFARPRSLTESYPRMVERVRGNPPIVDPRGVPQKLVPSRTDPSGWTYIEDRPSVLERASLGFGNPWHIFICLKRKIRKEVMHALGYAGGRHFKKPKFTQYSYVRCF